ncbi:MAG: cytochrome c oxidase assembly protein [Thiobacillus sp.]|nr:cytochrome c oxidase assembly protein [Thiobacillus sp.]
MISVLLGATLAGTAVPAHAHSLIDGALAQRLPALLTALLLVAAWLAYLVGSRRAAPRAGRAWLFHGAIALALFAVLGPLDDWAKTGAAMHMVQHMLLMAIIAPLSVLARPLPQWRAAVGDRARWLWLGPLSAARRPLAMAALHGATIWFWHAPRPYMLALEHPWWHAFEHACFLLSAGLFWWAVLFPSPPNRGCALLALLITLMHTGLLGALLTFATSPLYGDATDLADQQLAGLIMWVPGGLVYLAAAAYSSHVWMRHLGRRSVRV